MPVHDRSADSFPSASCINHSALQDPAHHSSALPSSSLQKSALRCYAIDVLISRSAYTTCHIQTADCEFRVPAIQVDGLYYSFFRVEHLEDDAIEVLKKLHARGDMSLVTVIPKGYAIWILETGAIAISAPQTPDIHPSDHLDVRQHPHYPEFEQLQNGQHPYQILTSRRQYAMVKAHIGGIDRPVSVVSFEGKYYSLVKTVRDIKQTAQIVKKISNRGSNTVVTRMPQGYGIWILEKNAKPIDT